MSDGEQPLDCEIEMPAAAKGAMIAPGALNTIRGAIPFAGGFQSAIAGAWGEKEQERGNRFFEHWMKMLAEEMREKEKTSVEIMSHLDMHDEEISRRVESAEYQTLLHKAFRDWAGVESGERRVLVRSFLVNAAASNLTNDDGQALLEMD
jgi:hypothetical protein